MQVEVIRSKRKSIAIQIKSDLKVIVRAPLKMSEVAINEFILDKSSWIRKRLEIVKKRNENSKNCQRLSVSEIKTLKKQASLIVLPKVEYFARIIGVKYKRVCFRAQSTRWGSCSVKSNLNFNCLLTLCPEMVIDYVVIHELCHLKHMNHSKKFWLTVEKFCPNYKICKKWLTENGSGIIERLR